MGVFSSPETLFAMAMAAESQGVRNYLIYKSAQAGSVEAQVLVMQQLIEAWQHTRGIEQVVSFASIKEILQDWGSSNRDLLVVVWNEAIRLWKKVREEPEQKRELYAQSVKALKLLSEQGFTLARKLLQDATRQAVETQTPKSLITTIIEENLLAVQQGNGAKHKPRLVIA